MQRGKILVIRGGAIGDFILSLPVLTALREQFPETHLELLGYPHIAELAQAGGLVDRVARIEARALAGFFARDGELDPTLAEYFARFNVIVSYLYDPDEVFQQNVRRSSTAQFIAGPHRPDETLDLHAAETFLKPLERLAIYAADSVPRLRSEGERPRELTPGRRLALHPGSGSELKNWPESSWAQLIRVLLAETSFQLLILGGEAEGERLHRLGSELHRDRGCILQSRPLVEVARALRQCVGFIGHDSGISHLAAALGLPCVILWGPTNAKIWRPLGASVELLQHSEGLASITVERVWREIGKLGYYR